MKDQNNTYLSFKLDKETYALHTDYILNIIEVSKHIKVPMTPKHVLGVFNFRGESVTLVDGRIKFNLNRKEIDKNSIIIVIQHENTKFGFLADSVEKTLIVEDKDILPTPYINTHEIVTGVIKNEDKFILIIDVNKTY